MSHNSRHSPTATYYLVCNPATGEVLLRTHKYNYQLAHLHHIKVSRVVWKQHRAGRQLDVSCIHEPELGSWLEKRALAIRKLKVQMEAQRVLEELDRDNLGTVGLTTQRAPCDNAVQ